MSARNVSNYLLVAAMLGFAWSGPTSAASVDCSLPIGQLTAAQFEGCLRPSPDQAKTVPLRIGDFDYVAPKPTTQRAYDDLLHAGD